LGSDTDPVSACFTCMRRRRPPNSFSRHSSQSVPPLPFIASVLTCLPSPPFHWRPLYPPDLAAPFLSGPTATRWREIRAPGFFELQLFFAKFFRAFPNQGPTPFHSLSSRLKPTTAFDPIRSDRFELTQHPVLLLLGSFIPKVASHRAPRNQFPQFSLRPALIREEESCSLLPRRERPNPDRS